jgi:multimeric flavodoxin WrbA
MAVSARSFCACLFFTAFALEIPFFRDGICFRFFRGLARIDLFKGVSPLWISVFLGVNSPPAVSDYFGTLTHVKNEEVITMDRFNVIGISCSPRKNGNTDILIQQVLESCSKEGAAMEFVRVSDMKISPCDACWSCAKTARCHIEDDMQDLYPKLLHADGIVIGSPVHMGYSVSGQAQVFLDRTFSLWHQKSLRNKVGGAVAVSNRRGGISTIRVINAAFFGHRIITAGYANGYGYAPGDVRKDERALNEATALGKRLCELISIPRRDMT